MSGNGAHLLQGHVLDVLASLDAESVNCVVTSPPYWSLRKYDAPDVVWGGDPACPHTHLEGSTVAHVESKRASAHQKQGRTSQRRGRANVEAQRNDYLTTAWVEEDIVRRTNDSKPGAKQATNACARCGAWRGQYGLEPTPELYVEHTLAWLRAVRRVLRKDGVVWLNIGDGYAGGGNGWGGKIEYSRDSKPIRAGSGRADGKVDLRHQRNRDGIGAVPGLKPKDLVLMPSRVALAAQADGWWVRSVVIWNKPNAMPSSVEDRPTTSHEYILMLTKSARYWYDQEAVRERLSGASISASGNKERKLSVGGIDDQMGTSIPWEGSGHNLRTVWTFPTAQTPEAHFATFPLELPLRCIQASCPREVCVKCGKARVRIVERQGNLDDRRRQSRRALELIKQHGLTDEHIRAVRAVGIDDAGKTPQIGSGRNVAEVQALADEVKAALGGYYRELLLDHGETTGWSDCGCEGPDYQPGLVLDPFAGLATTGLAALRLARRFIGIELSEKYAAMAEAKLARWWENTRLVEPSVAQEQERLPL